MFRHTTLPSTKPTDLAASALWLDWARAIPSPLYATRLSTSTAFPLTRMPVPELPTHRFFVATALGQASREMAWPWLCSMVLSAMMKSEDPLTWMAASVVRRTPVIPETRQEEIAPLLQPVNVNPRPPANLRPNSNTSAALTETAC